MKKRVLFLLIFLLPIFLEAQDKIYFAGIGSSYLIPTGSLKSRFSPAGGVNLFFGYKSSENWEWFGKIEYLNFNKENRERLKIRRNVNIAGREVTRNFNLPKLETDLKIYGASANANSKIIDLNFFKSDLTFGFGIYRWESSRSGYFDTLRVDTLGVTYDAVILKVPALKQLDWSGGFNVGLNLSTKIIDPIWFEVNANYKAVVGELWATLDLDLENISVFQMYEIRLGLKARF
ncbi:MAG: hypothetical protein N3F03_01795 [Ignavibacteria bacterium]|nr:hypothetical protein [Ignavibacteria bacterium]